MKIITANQVISAVRSLALRANTVLPAEVRSALSKAVYQEENALTKEVLTNLEENYRLAEERHLPLCQDTGTALVFLELGQEVLIKGGNLYESVNQGVAFAYKEGCFRASIVEDPVFNRKNTLTNTPAVIHLSLVDGENLKITFAAKGGGAENMSSLKMFSPTADWQQIKEFILQTVKNAGANPCPPIILGIGVGGNFETCALMAKKALLRPLGQSNVNRKWAEAEKDLQTDINNLGIGAQGFGGKITAFGVAIDYAPCHIASLPVAVNMQCHSHRHEEIIL